MTLALLLAVTTGAWADETPLLTIESTGYTDFKSGSQTFDDKVTVTFSNSVFNDGDNWGWFANKTASLLTVAGINGYTITSCKFYTAEGEETGYTVEGESPSVYLLNKNVYTDANQSVNLGCWGVTKIEVFGAAASASSGPEVAWDEAKKTGTFKMPGGNVTLEPEYYPQAEFAMSTGETPVALAPTAINDVPATTDGAIVKAGTVANIGTSEVKQGTLMYFVSTTEMTDAQLQALTPDQWSADVPTAADLAQGPAYVYYYIRGAEPATIAERTDANTCSDGDILAANVVSVTLAAEPTKVTMAVNDKTMGTAEVAGESKVEWTADTWKGWTRTTKEYTVDDITMTSTQSAYIEDYTREDDYLHSLSFFVNEHNDDASVTFSTTGDPFTRIEFTMIDDYNPGNGQGYHGIPNIQPADGWTVEGKSAVWEGEATKSLTLQSCSTQVSKITFYKGATPDGVTINGDGTFTVAKTATVTLKATPAEGYKFLYWEDDQTNTNPVRKVTIESGMDDMTYKAVFAEILYNVTFADGVNPEPPAEPEWTAFPNADVKKGDKVTVTYTGTRKVIGVKAEKKAAVDPAKAYLKWDAEQKKLVATEIPAEVTMVENSNAGVTWTAGTYVVDGQVTINGAITLSGEVDLIIKDGAKLTANKINGYNNNLSIYGQANQTGQLVVDNSGDDAITSIKTLEVHSAKVTATSSARDRGGIYYIGTINVYGGSVDAKNTAADGGYGIWLKPDGSVNIYGGEVKAVGKGIRSYGYGITAGNTSTVTVNGGKLWAENADKKALNTSFITLKKGEGFTGKIEYSSDNSTWSETVDADAKYVRAGY